MAMLLHAFVQMGLLPRSHRFRVLPECHTLLDCTFPLLDKALQPSGMLDKV